MINWEEFSQFGFVQYAVSRFYGHVELVIALQPAGCPDLGTDAEVRRAAYDLAEAAIAYAEERYELEGAPRLEVTGERRYCGETTPDARYVTDARLELCLRELA